MFSGQNSCGEGRPIIKMQTDRYLFRVRRQDIAYIRTTIESYDGAAVVSTINPHEACIEVQIAPECNDLIFGLLEHLAAHEKIRLNLKKC